MPETHNYRVTCTDGRFCGLQDHNNTIKGTVGNRALIQLSAVGVPSVRRANLTVGGSLIFYARTRRRG